MWLSVAQVAVGRRYGCRRIVPDTARGGRTRFTYRSAFGA
jgi:hypothetical protein